MLSSTGAACFKPLVTAKFSETLIFSLGLQQYVRFAQQIKWAVTQGQNGRHAWQSDLPRLSSRSLAQFGMVASDEGAGFS